MQCVVCGHATVQPIYASAQDVSITSLSKIIQAKTTVYCCAKCGHLYTQPVVDVDAYYDQSYNINTASEDEDQLYAMVDGKPVYRSEHQTKALMETLDIQHGARVLDYGCGPAHTTRALAQQRDDLAIHLFDVSENYKPSWLNWVDEARTACYETPTDWDGTFDLVASFFALEHVDDPRTFVRTLSRLLKPGGQAYLLVPNVYDNIADLIVVDHVNHFSETSITALLEAEGFTLTYLSSEDHSSAWTVVAKRNEDASEQTPSIDHTKLEASTKQALEMAGFWKDCDDKVIAFEQEADDLPATIYGSGFYGCYLYTRLSNPDRVQGFVDRNPHQQKKKLFGRSITDPATLDDQPRVVWVGLNPRIAKDAIAGLDAWQGRPYSYFYL